MSKSESGRPTAQTVHRRKLEPDERPSEGVVAGVAAAAGVDPTPTGGAAALDPLYEAVDGEALDALVSGLDAGEVRFEYAGYTVVVTHHRTVRVEERGGRGVVAGTTD